MNDLLLCVCVFCVSPSVSPWLRNLPVTAFDTLGSIMRFKERERYYDISCSHGDKKNKIKYAF